MRRRVAALVALVVLLLVGWLGLAWSRSALEAPPPTLQLVDVQGRFLGEVPADGDERLGFWPADPLPERVVAATLAAEDRRFWSHPGVDPVAIGRAARQNIVNGERISGASTLAMQVARLQRPGARTWPRKALEATTALFLVARHGREAVLAHYLRLAPYGNNVHGIAYAARRYLDKPVEDLSWAEVALLSGLPQAPGRMNVHTESGRRAAITRARAILDTLYESRAITAEDRDRAHEELDALRFPARAERPPEVMHAVLRLGRTLDRDAGPRVVTTLDLPLQRVVRAALVDELDELRQAGAGNAAAVVVERETGAVRAWVGSADWSDAAWAGSIDFADTPRSPGSALKPFLYAAALDRGALAPTEILADLRSGLAPIDNADHDELGPMLPRRALGNSRNVPAVELTNRLGLHPTHALLRQLHLHDDERPAEHYGTLVALGGLPVRLGDVVAAYVALANDGAWRPLVWVEGETARAERVLSADHSRRVLGWLADPMARLPSFPRSGHLDLPFPAAVKTGTAEDFRDAWAIGVTERYVVGVWVGRPDWRPMRELTGYEAGGALLGRLLRTLHAGDEGVARAAFPPPEGAVPVEVCAWSGQRATPRCDEVVTEQLGPAERPAPGCDVHVGEPGQPTTLALQGPLRAWAVARGLPVSQGPDAAPTLEIVAPANGARILRDPEAPGGRGTLALRVAVGADVAQVTWRVDGVEVALVEAPYQASWTLEPGAHVIEAEALGVRSAPVRVTVH